MNPEMSFPDDRRFAFTVLDDTDDATLENVRPIYDLLASLGMRTTKTVWTLDSPTELKGHYRVGETLEDPAYRAWVLELAEQGFEIAFHNASMISSTRERTQEALDTFREVFSKLPRLHCNHGQNEENLYWGADRYSGPVRHLYRLMGPLRDGPAHYQGHDENSPYFWGDIALETFDYVRAFAFQRVDCSQISPGHPYSDPERPWVRRWFNTADAPAVEHFKRLLTPSRIRELRDRGGWCVVSTHFGKGFVEDGRVDPEVEEILRMIAAEPGWFVPTSTLLDHLCAERAPAPITTGERFRLETGHFTDRVSSRLRHR